MGEIADLMLEGDLCEGCGCEMGPGDGYPRRCRACAKEHAAYAREATACSAPIKVSCPTCKKKVKRVGLQDHMRDVHHG